VRLIIKNPFFDFSGFTVKPEENSDEQVPPSAAQHPLCYHYCVAFGWTVRFSSS